MYSLLQDADEITAYIDAHRLLLARYEATGDKPPRPVTRDAVREMLSATATLWGTTLPYYLRATIGLPSVSVLLSTAVADVESRPNPADLLLVGYQDGGLIVVTGVRLPFQKTANDAAWWHPSRA